MNLTCLKSGICQASSKATSKDIACMQDNFLSFISLMAIKVLLTKQFQRS